MEYTQYKRMNELLAIREQKLSVTQLEEFAKLLKDYREDILEELALAKADK